MNTEVVTNFEEMTDEELELFYDKMEVLYEENLDMYALQSLSNAYRELKKRNLLS